MLLQSLIIFLLPFKLRVTAFAKLYVHDIGRKLVNRRNKIKSTSIDL